MRYRILFANQKVGQANCPPFELEAPDGYGVEGRTIELSRLIRSRVVDALTGAPAPGASTAATVIDANTLITLDLAAGEGAAHYGTTDLGSFNVYPMP